MPRTVDLECWRESWNAHTRGGWVLLALWQGAKLSNRDIARTVGTGRRGAQRIAENLSLRFPIVYINNKWQWMEPDD